MLCESSTGAPEWKQIKQHTTYQRPCFQRGLLYNYKFLKVTEFLMPLFISFADSQSVRSEFRKQEMVCMKHAFSLQLQSHTRTRYATYRIESSMPMSIAFNFIQ